MQRTLSNGQGAGQILELVVVLRFEHRSQRIFANRGFLIKAVVVLTIFADSCVARLSFTKDARIAIAVDESFYAVITHIRLQGALTGLTVNGSDVSNMDGQSSLIDCQSAVVKCNVVILLGIDIRDLEVPAIGPDILARLTHRRNSNAGQALLYAKSIGVRQRVAIGTAFDNRAITPSEESQCRGVLRTIGLFLGSNGCSYLAASNMQGRVVAHEVVVTIGASVLVIDFDRNGIVARSGIYIGIGAHHGGAAKQLFDGDGTGIQFFLVGSRQTGYVPCKFRIGLAVFTAELRLVIVAVLNHRGNDDRILDNVQLCGVESNGIVRVRQAADINIVVTNRRVLVSVRMQTAGQLVAVDKAFCMIG